MELNEHYPFELKAAQQWTVSDVSDWLKSIGLEAYRDHFSDHSIDGQELLMLTEANLKNVLKVGAFSSNPFFISKLGI